MPHLIERPVFKQDAGSPHQAHRLALYMQFDAAIRGLGDLLELVDREEVAHPVAETFRHHASVFSERLRGLGGLPAAVFVLKRLWEVPVIQRRKRLDARGLQLVHQTVVEVEPFLI